MSTELAKLVAMAEKAQPPRPQESWLRKRLRLIFCHEPSDTARAILWLYTADPNGWRQDNYGAVHVESGVGIWLANQAYGLSVYCNITKADAQNFFVLHGKKIELSSGDCRLLWRVIGRSGTPRQRGGEVPEAISEWALGQMAARRMRQADE